MSKFQHATAHPEAVPVHVMAYAATGPFEPTPTPIPPGGGYHHHHNGGGGANMGQQPQQQQYDATMAYLQSMENGGIAGHKDRINKVGGKAFLASKNWPEGLQDACLRAVERIPIRFFICDNSGSMITNDGHKLVDNSRLVGCTRWSELGETLKFHIELSYRANCPSEFRLLNNFQPVLVNGESDEGMSIMTGLLCESPSGGTPLCRHISEVINKIDSIKHVLRQNNQKACVIIATDGDSSDGDVLNAMRRLKDLPVWTVVRLCTDDEKIVNYWNNIDGNLEMDMDILDDLKGEAEEIFEHNPWITYGQPLHQMREFGISSVKEFDLLDEAALTAEQMSTLVYSVVGGRKEDYPDPQVNYSNFAKIVSDKQKAMRPMWDPITGRPQPPIRMTALKKTYSPGGCSIS